MEIAAQISLNAVIAGAIYSLAALGFNLVYSTARFFDVSYGAVAAAGAYVVFYFYKTLDFDVLSAIGIGILSAGVLGFLIEKVVYRQLRAKKASQTVLLIASLGVLTVVQAVVAIMFSSQFQTLSRNFGSTRIFDVFGGVITQTQVIILCSSLLTMTALALMMRYTLFGRAARAVADDAEVAQIVGINGERVIGVVFFIASVIGGIAGIAVGFDTGIQPTMGMSLLLPGVVAAVIGGVGNVYGGVVGAFVLAVVENAAVWYLPGEWKAVIAFAVLILFLLFRPQGLLPK